MVIDFLLFIAPVAGISAAVIVGLSWWSHSGEQAMRAEARQAQVDALLHIWSIRFPDEDPPDRGDMELAWYADFLRDEMERRLS